MQPQNYTPIDDLVAQYKAFSPRAPEAEPVSPREPVKFSEQKGQEPQKEDLGKYLEEAQHHVELSEELKKAGVENDEPVDLTRPELHLPLPDEKIVVGLHAPFTSSIRWLSTFALYLLHLAHLTLKTVHGKVVRVRA